MQVKYVPNAWTKYRKRLFQFPNVLRENRGVLRSESSRGFVKLERLADRGRHSNRTEALVAKGIPCILLLLNNNNPQNTNKQQQQQQKQRYSRRPGIWSPYNGTTLNVGLEVHPLSYMSTGSLQTSCSWLCVTLHITEAFYFGASSLHTCGTAIKVRHYENLHWQ